MREDSEILNKLSEILFGYREASNGDIIAKVLELKRSDKELRFYKGAPKLAVAVRNAIATMQQEMERVNEAQDEECSHAWQDITTPKDNGRILFCIDCGAQRKEKL